MHFRMNGESDPGDGEPGDILPTGGGTFYQQNTSDDSDNEQEMYEGYEPLNGDASNIEVWDNMEASEDVPMTQEAPPADVPAIESVDTEVQREVWNDPRPEALTIDLDGDKEREIMNVMAGFSLPPTAIPTWAQGVSEKEWKEDLLKRIRDRKSD
uniref:Male-enhanced antigen 1 n=1 Tax=Lutzomyia longipalpis TaxID=7200 RepID=A0A7G3AKQ0_LUTLO